MTTTTTVEGGEADQSDQQPEERIEPDRPPEPVSFKVVYAKEAFQLDMDLNDTILQLKDRLFELTSVTTVFQKLCFKGNL